MKHKHAELIHAWADGAEIQIYVGGEGWDDEKYPQWEVDEEYRIKPETKPDIVLYMDISLDISNGSVSCKQYFEPTKNVIKATFDGQTGKSKSAEVLK